MEDISSAHQAFDLSLIKSMPPADKFQRRYGHAIFGSLVYSVLHSLFWIYECLKKIQQPETTSRFNFRISFRKKFDNFTLLPLCRRILGSLAQKVAPQMEILNLVKHQDFTVYLDTVKQSNLVYSHVLCKTHSVLTVSIGKTILRNANCLVSVCCGVSGS